MQDPSSEQRGVAIHDPAADMRGPEAQDDGMRSDSVAAREATAPCGPMPAPGDARLPAVRLFGKLIGALDLCSIGIRLIDAYLFEDHIEGNVSMRFT